MLTSHNDVAHHCLNQPYFPECSDPMQSQANGKLRRDACLDELRIWFQQLILAIVFLLRNATRKEITYRWSTPLAMIQYQLGYWMVTGWSPSQLHPSTTDTGFRACRTILASSRRWHHWSFVLAAQEQAVGPHSTPARDHPGSKIRVVKEQLLKMTLDVFLVL
jgi:hypothetical protein